jgi:hypothetical protein
MKQWLLSVYMRIGIHTAPPGTLFYRVHYALRRMHRFRLYRYATASSVMSGPFGATRLYDIARLRRSRQVDGLALIFFMGAGDYLMATPLIRALRAAYPDLPLYAYASSHADLVNSPLVIQLLQTNPLIDRVIPYRGRPRPHWLDYDFSDALSSVPKGFVILPVVYETNPVIYHRVTALLEAFRLPIDFPIPVPIVYETKLSVAAETILESIRSRIRATDPEGVVCCHFGARSSGYEYPGTTQLISQLMKKGLLVINFSPAAVEGPSLIQIDVSTITANDSIEILRILKAEQSRLAMITVNSIMWPISAALDIPNLGLHVFWDGAVHQYVYPNLFVVTNHAYQTLSPSRLFLAAPGSYRTRRSTDERLEFADYKPEFILDSYEVMVRLNFGEEHSAAVAEPLQTCVHDLSHQLG